MKVAARFLFVLWVLVFLPLAAHATITCSTVTSSGFTWYYVNGTTAGVQLSYTLTCNRSATTDPTSFSYSNNANNGLHADKAQLGATNKRLSYNLFRGSCSGSAWSNNNPTNIDGTISWAASQTGIGTDTEFYWACINTAQTATASGWYTDSVTMTVKGSGVNFTGSIPINIFAPSSCSISTGPGAIAMSYTAFSAAAVTASTNFRATCSSGMSYTIDVSPTSGTLAGVAYTVAPDATTFTGTGGADPHSITATAVAGQAGTCSGTSCTASQTHTLTIGY